MSGIITMVDESLGGVLREYRQVATENEAEFRTTQLEATDVVVIDGERYRMVDRKAEVGEKVIIVNAERACGKYHDGDVIEARSVDNIGIENEKVSAKDNPDGLVIHREYVVLEPLPSEECTGEPVTVSASDIRWNPDKVIDMFVALAQRNTELEKKLNELADTNERALKRVADRVEENGKNVETLAQDLEAVKAIMLSNEEDIRTLDERTQSLTPKSGAKLLAEAFEALANYERGVGR